MNRRILSVTIAVLGLIAIALAVCSATIWRPSSTAQASLTSTPDLNYVVTEPGVLGLVDSDVTVTATAASPSTDVVIAVGRSSDVKSWLVTDPYVSVTGLTDWTTLSATAITTSCQADPSATETPASAEATEPAAGEAPASAEATDATAAPDGCTPLESSGANPAGSDLWLATETGTGTATLELDASDSDLVVLVATNGSEPAPQVALSWPRNVATPWLVPGLVVGGVLLLIGIFLFLIDIQARHADEKRRARAAERAARIAHADGVSTAGIPQVGDPERPLSRREKRDKERAEASGQGWVDPRTGLVHRSGVEVPAVPLAPGHETMIADPDPALGGPARGSVVVPGLDSEATAAHRAVRDGNFEEPFSTSDLGAGPDSGFSAPAGYGSQDPAGFGPQAPAGYGPQDPAGFGPQGPVEYGPQDPAGFGPQAPAGYGSQDPSVYAPQDPDGYSPQAPSVYGTAAATGYGMGDTASFPPVTGSAPEPSPHDSSEEKHA